MLETYRDVVPLVHNVLGWSKEQIRINHNPNPSFDPQMKEVLAQAIQRTIQERTAEHTGGRFNDTDGAKSAVRRLIAEGKTLSVDTIATTYFVLWGLPGVAPKLHKQALDDLKTTGKSTFPMGISTHNIVLLTPDGNRTSESTTVAMIVNDPSHGFAPGRLSASYEGQLDPTKDLDQGIPSTFDTVLRTVGEEFGIGLEGSPIRIDPSAIRLLAVCGENGSAYTSWLHIVWAQGTPENLVASYQLAPRRRDANALLAVPFSKIDAFTEDAVMPRVYQPHMIAGLLEGQQPLKSHATVPWRVDALKEYMAIVSH